MTCLDKRIEREREIKQGEKGDHILIRRPDFVVDVMRTDTPRKDASSSVDFFFSFWRVRRRKVISKTLGGDQAKVSQEMR